MNKDETVRPKLTGRQLDALLEIGRLAAKFPKNETFGFGFNANAFYPGNVAMFRRVLEPMGLVKIDRISANHSRYSITDAGRKALSDHAQT